MSSAFNIYFDARKKQNSILPADSCPVFCRYRRQRWAARASVTRQGSCEWCSCLHGTSWFKKSQFIISIHTDYWPKMSQVNISTHTNQKRVKFIHQYVLIKKSQTVITIYPDPKSVTIINQKVLKISQYIPVWELSNYHLKIFWPKKSKQDYPNTSWS